jgi:hypothetical protein
MAAAGDESARGFVILLAMTTTSDTPEIAAGKAAKRPPPAYLFALGRRELPQTVTAEERTYRFVELFKHDFFAATGLYEQTSDGPEKGALAVLKVQRTHHWWGFPMHWLGRIVANREIRIYQKLQGVPGIPAFLGRVGTTGFLHAFIPGVDLHADLPLTPAFFEQLGGLFQALHERRIAYVDANKRENILYGCDGRPWLIDFQISFHSRWQSRWNVVGRWWFRRFEQADWYHFYKHKTRLLPAACTAEDFARAERRGWLHRVHRRVARPFIHVRRRLLSRYALEKVR